MQRSLGLAAQQQPRPDRLLQLAAQLIETICHLDQAGLKTLGQLSSRSALLTRPEDFRKLSARYLTGEVDSIEGQTRAMGALLGALFAAMLAGGRDFGRQYVERFSPSAIEDVIASGSGSGIRFMGPNKKERCWDHYTELSKDYSTADLIDRRIKDCLGAYVERTVRGGR
jgi:hypothetical protein